MSGTVASVGYLNARPLTDDLDETRWTVVRDHPAAIAAQLHDGTVDIALVPVAAILGGGDWRVVPSVCIGADGAVASVLLAAETEPEQWTEVVLDGESRTSAVLAQLLLRQGPLSERVPAGLTIRTVDPGAGPGLATGSTATLVIGDAALALPDRLTTRIDLAAAWKAWTDLPFVFAVWAGRPTVDGALVNALRIAGQSGVAAIPERYSGAERAYLTENIRFTLDDAALMGLRRFAALAHRAGLLASEHLELYGPGEAAIPRPENLDALLEAAIDGADLPEESWIRLEVAAPLTTLAAAADLKRSDAHPGDTVGYRLGWRMTSADDLPAAIAAGAEVVVVDAAADRQALQAAYPGVHFALDEDDLATVVRVGAGESGLERVRALLALKEQGVQRIRVVAADHPGKPAASEANTAVDHLRAVALARLILDRPHLEASQPTEGIGMAQTSLRAGCDHLGTVFPTEPLDQWDAAVTEIERQIRDAGFTPARAAGP